MAEAHQLSSEFTIYACNKLRDSLAQIEHSLNLLEVEQIWERPNAVSNAVGNLVQHLTGNVRQCIVGAIGGESFERDRPAEFAQRAAVATGVLLANLSDSVERATEVIASMDGERLLATFTIQGYTVSGMAAVFHVVEHFSLHTGQIVYATKALTGLDLSLYDAQGRRSDGRTLGTP